VNLSPALRAIAGALVAAGTAALTVLADDAFTVADGIIVALAFVGTFAVVPPQVGGTQQGVVNPSLTEPPRIDGEAGYGLIEALVVIFLVLVILLVLLRF
jgi:hypothetical protein